MSAKFWEDKLEEFKNSHTFETAQLDYLDLATESKVSNKDLAYNLKILAYRTDLGNKVSLSAIHHLHKLTVQELKEDNLKLQANYKACKKELLRQADLIQELKASQEVTQQRLQWLKDAWSERRPLTKQDVEDLVLKISEQPKFIEQQTEALTTELSQKLDKVEKLIHQLEGLVMGV